MLVADVGESPSQLEAGFTPVANGGKVVLTGLNRMKMPQSSCPARCCPCSASSSLFGDCNPTTDITEILGLCKSGDVKLDEIITRTYTLEQINEGYEVLDGKNVRGTSTGAARPGRTRIRTCSPLR